MTGSAGFPCIHFMLWNRLLARAGRNDLVVAVMALIAPVQVNFVAENHRFHIFFPGEIISDRLENWMALPAVASHIESILAIMTESAGIPFFHIMHGESLVEFTGQKSFVVAVIATVQTSMKLVAECDP